MERQMDGQMDRQTAKGMTDGDTAFFGSARLHLKTTTTTDFHIQIQSQLENRFLSWSLLLLWSIFLDVPI